MPHKPKVIFFLIDGLSDVSPLLNTNSSYPTRISPLSASKTPTLDYLASIGANGLIDPVGIVCHSVSLIL